MSKRKPSKLLTWGSLGACLVILLLGVGLMYVSFFSNGLPKGVSAQAATVTGKKTAPATGFVSNKNGGNMYQIDFRLDSGGTGSSVVPHDQFSKDVGDSIAVYQENGTWEVQQYPGFFAHLDALALFVAGLMLCAGWFGLHVRRRRRTPRVDS